MLGKEGTPIKVLRRVQNYSLELVPQGGVQRTTGKLRLPAKVLIRKRPAGMERRRRALTPELTFGELSKPNAIPAGDKTVRLPSGIRVRSSTGFPSTSRSAIPPSLMASSTVWFTTPTASRCAENPCAKNEIRHRTRRRNDQKQLLARGKLLVGRDPGTNQECPRRSPRGLAVLSVAVAAPCL